MTALAQRIAREFGTPAVVIDLDRVERNIARVQAACDAAGVANRPHIKTHKIPDIAKMQRDAGAAGITCQKIGEAEVMSEAGLDDILISYNLLGEDKMARLAKVMERASVTVAADNPTVVAGLPRAAELSGRTLNVVVECDTGRKRAGVETAAEAIALAKDIAAPAGALVCGLHALPARGRDGGHPEVPRRGDGGRARGRPRGPHGLDRRHAERRQSRQDQGRDRAPRRHLRLQRPHDARLRRRRHGRSRASRRRDDRRAGPARSAASSTPARRR